MVDEVYQIEKADREQHIVGQQALANDVTASRRMADNRDRGSNQTQYEEFETELAKHEADDRRHFFALCVIRVGPMMSPDIQVPQHPALTPSQLARKITHNPQTGHITTGPRPLARSGDTYG